jgi:phytol kinase
MKAVLEALTLVFLTLLASEFAWRKNIVRKEWGRKIIHVVVGIQVAFWPWLLSFKEIGYITLLFVVVVVISRRLKLFKAILDIDRTSAGDVLFAVGIAAAAFLTNDKLIFCIAILHMAIADALAALMGRKFGKKTRFKIMGAEKSITGSIVFFVISFVLLMVYWNLHQMGSSIVIALDKQLLYAMISNLAALCLAVIEAISPYGTDNVTVPIATVVLLKLLLV